MQINISKSNYDTLMSLIDKAVVIIQQGSPSTKEYNVARQLRQTKKSIIRNMEKKNGRTDET